MSDNVRTFKHQIAPFVREKYRVLIPVLRGYEASSQSSNYHVSALMLDVICLLDALAIEQADILGYVGQKFDCSGLLFIVDCRCSLGMTGELS